MGLPQNWSSRPFQHPISNTQIQFPMVRQPVKHNQANALANHSFFPWTSDIQFLQIFPGQMDDASRMQTIINLN